LRGTRGINGFKNLQLEKGQKVLRNWRHLIRGQEWIQNVFKKIHYANLKHSEGSKFQNKTNNDLKKIIS